MKQYRQIRHTNEQTWTTEYIAPVCNTYLQHRQTDNRTRTMDLLATDSQLQYCVYNNTIRLVPNHVMSILRHGYFSVIKLCTKRLKYKTTPFAFNLHYMR